MRHSRTPSIIPSIRRSTIGRSHSRPCRCGPSICFISPRPGDEGADDQSGVIVLDADHDYRFVKRIPYGLPASELPGPKISGMTSSIPANMIYVTTDGGSMIAFDLKTDKIAWTFNGESKNGNGSASLQRRRRQTAAASGPRRCRAARPCWSPPAIITGGIRSTPRPARCWARSITPDSPIAHNLTVTADGKIGMLGSLSPRRMTRSSTCRSRQDVCATSPSAIASRPLTINHDGSLVYANVNNLDGFEIGDTKTGKMIKRVELPGEMWKAKWADPNGHFFGHGLPSHGIGMTPDESEIWVTDGANDAWQVWDNPGDGRNPVYNPSKTVKMPAGRRLELDLDDQ